MSETVEVFLLTLAAGLAMSIGALLAALEHIKPLWLEEEFRHAVIAFGGGALLSAVTLVLVPEGVKNLSAIAVCLCFAGGGVFFMFIDRLLASNGTPASQLAAMLSDFIPEALALGALAAVSRAESIFLAILIALQNLPEGFNSYREIISTNRYKKSSVLLVFFALALIGPVAGLSGLYFLADKEAILSAIMVFAAGGILYIVFQDIAPQAKLKNHWAPPLGAVGGYMLGIIGQLLLVGH